MDQMSDPLLVEELANRVHGSNLTIVRQHVIIPIPEHPGNRRSRAAAARGGREPVGEPSGYGGNWNAGCERAPHSATT